METSLQAAHCTLHTAHCKCKLQAAKNRIQNYKAAANRWGGLDGRSGRMLLTPPGEACGLWKLCVRSSLTLFAVSLLLRLSLYE